MWLSRVDLGRGREPVYLCRVHQQTFDIDYPPAPPLK